MSKKKYDTIVVGGGIAGLTSAAYLARSKKKVLLIEKNETCGGLVNTFEHNGFYFDAGVRALEDAGIIFPMLNDLDISLETVKSPVSVGIEKEVLNIEGIDSLMDYRDLLVRMYPQSEKEVDSIIKIIRKVMKYMDVLYGIENPMFKDLKRDTGFVFKTLLPWLPRFLLTLGKINKMNVPVESYLEKIIENTSLRDIIAQHFFKNTPAFFALSYFSLYLDYFYPKGGVGKLAEVVKDKVIEYGGEILTGTRITEVFADRCQIRDENGNFYEYNSLVWAADLKTFYSITKTANLDPRTKDKFEEAKRQFLNCRGGDSVFSVFLEVDEPLESFRKIAYGHFFYTPSRTGLGETHKRELNLLLGNWKDKGKEEVLNWVDKFLNLNTYEISIPGLKDPQMVPKGKTGVIISLLAEYDLFEKVRKDGWYDEFKSELEKRIVKVISNSIYPMLKEKVTASFSFSPLSIQERVGTSEGAITGWAFEKHMPVINKIASAGKAVLTPIPNIFQAGQWAYSPAGVPMSILTGKIAAEKATKIGKSKF
ncbi:amine oxidase [Kosmotoga arenicorallina S304]|uniref:Amine oxidase n=1 Tax=Kosmotoga arenicorallina S304 TaxID=1453497 RepID=A0A176K0L0_9BACT|nr:NAD(P)/FAD-dependent oxidoreductase [Kosmotoga arenicorallina]OAA30081.1 amine oxidase [Kosmotoga arenicorallina S304]